MGGVIPVKENEFRPDEYATRQDVTVALVNIIELSEIMKMQEGECGFVDTPMIDKEYISHIGKAVSAGIISGYEDGRFRPHESITRAEVATLIYRLIRQ